MNIWLIFLFQALVYSVFPFYFARLRYHLRSISFYVYLGIVLVLGGFMGSVYSFPLTNNITVSGGNLTYGAFMMGIILLVMLEGDMDVVRNMIRLVITVNAFVFILFTALGHGLGNPEVINVLGTPAALFSVAIQFMILGGVLIVLELLIFLFVFEHVKQHIKNPIVLGALYLVFYIITLALDGVLFPAIALFGNPALVDIIAGNVSGKLVMGTVFSIPMALFLYINRNRFVEFIETPLTFSNLLKPSRQMLQNVLTDTQKSYQLLVETSPYAIGIYQHGRIVFVNEAAVELIGKSRKSELVGELYSSVIAPVFFKRSHERLQRVLKGETGIYPLEDEFVRQDGTTVPVEINAVPMLYRGEPAVQVITIDITERIHAQQTKDHAARLQIELEKERELRELKSRFTSMIVHDFRNPVASISLSAELIPRYAGRMDVRKIEEKTAQIITNTRVLNKLIDDVLELGRMETLETNFSPEPRDVEEFCSELFEDFQRQHESKPYKFVFTSVVDRLVVDLDEELFRRAIGNLLSNAVKYSPDGGTITMIVAREQDSVILKIADTGIGIPANELPRIFDFFHRANNASDINGTGVGLTIVKQIVEAHDGQIVCESEVGVGTTFTITLPLA
ncbi:MAG: PAS domain-containing sensor histidine kinase [Chloroflexota bacterium]